jgi:tRNA pseudouridine55 synthase
MEVAREPRWIIIHKLELLDRTEDTLILDIRCSKGTYVRTLAEDIGEVLGCGAHVSGLRRLGIGSFDAPDMIRLDALGKLAMQGFERLARRLLPIDSALAGWPALYIDGASEFHLKRGQAVQIPDAPTEGRTRLYDRGHLFIGLGRVLSDGRVAPECTINVRRR